MSTDTPDDWPLLAAYRATRARTVPRQLASTDDERAGSAAYRRRTAGRPRRKTGALTAAFAQRVLPARVT